MYRLQGGKDFKSVVSMEDSKAELQNPCHHLNPKFTQWWEKFNQLAIRFKWFSYNQGGEQSPEIYSKWYGNYSSGILEKGKF